MEGFEDPFNRGTFPWGREDKTLQAHFRTLGRLRRERVSLRRGDIRYLFAGGHGLAFSRSWKGETTVAALNTGLYPVDMELPWDGPTATDALSGQQFLVVDGTLRLTVPPLDGLLLI